MRAYLLLSLLCASALAGNEPGDTERVYAAIRSGDIAALQALLRASSPDLRDSRGTTPLMYAAAAGNIETMRALIGSGADVKVKNDFDITALMWCATDEAKVRLLVANGADVNARSTQGRTPLLIAASSEPSAGILKLLLDNGAELKKADADPVNTPLVAAAAANDTAAVRLLLERGAEFRGPSGGTALTNAAAHGNVEMMKMLLERGVPPDEPAPPSVAGKVKNGVIALGAFTPLIFASSYGGPEAVLLLLDRKANVNAQDVRGMTALMFAIALDHPDPRVVRLLLEHGADVKIQSKAGETALDWARKFNHPEILAALRLQAASQTAPVLAAEARAPREAVRRSVELLQKTSDSFFRSGGCASCHSHNVTSLAFGPAEAAGIRQDEALRKARRQQTELTWAPQAQTLMLRMDAPGGHYMVANAALEFAAEGVKPGLTTDAMVHNIAAQQQVNGSWHLDGLARPPMTDGDFSNTALAIRALAVYGSPARGAEFRERIGRGAAWLRAAQPATTEDATMQVLGLVWSGVATKDELAGRVKALVAMQRPDGGWAQTPYLLSDAYATGETLAALRQAGVPLTDEAYRRGAKFLLRTQRDDGSWHVVSRSPKFQPYFQSGFPYDHDQWISMAATAWATAALAGVPGV